MGWQRKILRVDLTKGTSKSEPLNMQWAKAYLGQRGLGSKYLVEEVNPRTDPLSQNNKLIFATGPLTGTMASTGGRYSVITKGALTGAIAASNSGGKFGAEIKFAGYDMIIVEGKAKRPVYLLIRDDDVQILPAKGLWGQTVWETERIVKERHGDPQIKIASIGRAGETGCRFACIVNDLHRAAGRSGVGTVMGSKNLKAIAIRGTRGVMVDDPKKFMKVVVEGHKLLAESEDRQGLTEYGTNSMMDVVQTYGSLPTRNNRATQFKGASKISAEAMKTPKKNGHVNLLTNEACFGCTIGCGRIVHIDPKHFSVKDKPQYHGASGGLEYETAYALGAMVGVDDIDAATYCGYRCNEDGMDPISLGGSIAAAMELFETGAITEKQTRGIKLKFGSAKALVEIVDLIAEGKGFGKEIAQGSKRLCRKYGHPEFSMAVKGQEFAGYDGRAMQGMGLGYATSNRGACHLRADPFATDFTTTDSKVKPQIVKDSQEVVAAVDSSGLCLFPKDCGWPADMYARHIDAACEGKWTTKRMQETGERIWNMERLFNLAAGFKGKDDTLPKRILTEPLTSGEAKGLVSQLDVMLPEYYKLRGWSDQGVPSKATLKRLAL